MFVLLLFSQKHTLTLSYSFHTEYEGGLKFLSVCPSVRAQRSKTKDLYSSQGSSFSDVLYTETLFPSAKKCEDLLQ